ncbi:MAG: putative DNA-binding domain-containing protein [Neisseria sp.]|nr:putative DNA-binding domain-containing protein [Neisseria sp.]
MPPLNPTQQAQKQLADCIRNERLAVPENWSDEHLAVYRRLVQNNVRSFLDLCFSDSQNFVDAQQWQNWQQRFLDEARPESPFFNDIPSQFLTYLRGLQDEMPSAAVLEMMDFETALLHAETAIQPSADGIWQDDSVLTWANAARLRHYQHDFVSSELHTIEEGEIHVLTWRNRDEEVVYRSIDGIDLFLLQYFQEQDSTFADLCVAVQDLLGEQNVREILRAAIQEWFNAGVLLLKGA